MEIRKTNYSGFFGTNLDELIGALKIKRIIVGSINTHACVRTTVIDAYQRNLDMIVAKDCVGSYQDDHHQITLQYFEPKIAKALSNKKIKELLSNKV